MLRSFQSPVAGTACDAGYSLVSHINRGAPRLLKQQTIEFLTRKNRDRMPHLKSHPLPRRTDQLTVVDRIAFALGIGEKWILLRSLMRESAAAGFFPGKLFLEEQNLVSSRRQPGSDQSASRTASNDSD